VIVLPVTNRSFPAFRAEIASSGVVILDSSTPYAMTVLVPKRATSAKDLVYFNIDFFLMVNDFK
jgi:hypothetical protein